MLTAAEREAIRGDAERAGVWLRGLLHEDVLRADLRAACDAASALAIRAVLAPGGAAQRDVRDAAALVAELRALAPAPPPPVPAPTRLPVRCDAALWTTVLSAPPAAVADVCDAIEAGGLDAPGAASRRELGLALAARAFSAARALAAYGAAMRIARVVAAQRLDAPSVRELLRVVRAMQRAGGAFGHLPFRDSGGNDLRAAVHVPYTLASLWTMHDACADRSWAQRDTFLT